MTKNTESRPASHATGQVTLEEVKAMSDEELKIAIAEIHGWKIFGLATNPKNKTIKARFSRSTRIRNVPDYPNDLNAVYAVEEIVIAGDITYRIRYEMQPSIKYGNLLSDLTGKTNPFHATARQRCEALVLTLSLDSKNKRVTSVSKEK